MTGTAELMSVVELASALPSGDVVVLDLRASERTVLAHIPGSWLVEPADLPRRLRDADDPLRVRLGEPGVGDGARTVDLCVICEDGDVAGVLAILEEVGLYGRRLAGGVAAWSRAGWPLNRDGNTG